MARFLGDAEFVVGTVRDGAVHTPLGAFPTTASETGEVEVMIRPESVALRRDDAGPAQVVSREFYGHDQVVTLDLGDGRRLLSRIGPHPDLRPGDRVDYTVEEVVVFPMAAGHRH